MSDRFSMRLRDRNGIYHQPECNTFSSEQRAALDSLGLQSLVAEYHPSAQPTSAELHELDEKKRKRKNELQNSAYDRDTHKKWKLLDTAYKIDGVQFAMEIAGGGAAKARVYPKAVVTGPSHIHNKKILERILANPDSESEVTSQGMQLERHRYAVAAAEDDVESSSGKFCMQLCVTIIHLARRNVSGLRAPTSEWPISL
jgi:hypothetical protein